MGQKFTSSEDARRCSRKLPDKLFVPRSLNPFPHKNSPGTQKHGNIIPLQGDVTSKEDLLKIVDRLTKTEGFVNLVVANSGLQGPGLDKLPQKPSLGEIRDTLWAMDDQLFSSVFKVNNTGVFYTVVAFLPLLEAGNAKGNVEQKSQVIATSSVASFNRAAFSGFAYSG